MLQTCRAMHGNECISLHLPSLCTTKCKTTFRRRHSAFPAPQPVSVHRCNHCSVRILTSSHPVTGLTSQNIRQTSFLTVTSVRDNCKNVILHKVHPILGCMSAKHHQTWQIAPPGQQCTAPTSDCLVALKEGEHHCSSLLAWPGRQCVGPLSHWLALKMPRAEATANLCSLPQWLPHSPCNTSVAFNGQSANVRNHECH